MYAGEDRVAGLVADRPAVERDLPGALDALERRGLLVDLIFLARGDGLELVHRLVDGGGDVGAVDRELGAAELLRAEQILDIGHEIAHVVLGVAVGVGCSGRLLLGLVRAGREVVHLEGDALGQRDLERAAPGLVPLRLVERGDRLLLRHAADVDAADVDVGQVGVAVRDEIGRDDPADADDQRERDDHDHRDQPLARGLARFFPLFLADALALGLLGGQLLGALPGLLFALGLFGGSFLIRLFGLFALGGLFFFLIRGLLRGGLFLFGLGLILRPGRALFRPGLFRAAVVLGRSGGLCLFLFLRRGLLRLGGLLFRGALRRGGGILLRQAGKELLVEPGRVVSVIVAHA